MFNGFCVIYDRVHRITSDEMQMPSVVKEEMANGAVCTRSTYIDCAADIQVCTSNIDYPGHSATVVWSEVRNISQHDVKINRIDSFKGNLPYAEYMLDWYTSSWGQEFTPHSESLRGTRILESTTGRSSNGVHPWFALTSASGGVLLGEIAWSGNWIVRIEPAEDGLYLISGGLSNWEFYKVLAPGESMKGPEVVLVWLDKGSKADASIEISRFVRQHWIPANGFRDSMPVEWNHWWPYTDTGISEKVFRANVDVCAEIGVDICTLDAGWFGRPDRDIGWWETQGDWDIVQSERFPSGIRALSDYVHSKGMKFGIWCEIEALGKKALIGSRLPEITATRNGDRLGYVCLGCSMARDWAFETLKRLIEEYKADWIKLDFNLDPGAGCNRTDHGHGAGDGLYEHYLGYYSLLDQVRAAYPDVVLENCSSGGLRVDLGLLRHLHVTFLSDPDYTEHSLQLSWGASTGLPASACLKWTWSQNLFDNGENGCAEPIQGDMTRQKFDYIVRAALMHHPGISYRLPDYPKPWLSRLSHHIQTYKSRIAEYVASGDMHRLTAQPLRGYKGDRWCSFLITSADKASAVLFVFRLSGSEVSRTLHLDGLADDRHYRLVFEDAGEERNVNGCDLIREGIAFNWLPEEASEIVWIAAT